MTGAALIVGIGIIESDKYSMESEKISSVVLKKFEFIRRT